MSSNEVGYIEGVTLKRYNNKNNKQETIAGLRSQRDYVTYSNAVDNNYHGSSFY